jgi:choline dehydrogenase-like flavoprotein
MSHDLSQDFDALIIGSGAGGCAAAYRLADAGLRVALIEKGCALPRDASTLDFTKVVHEGAFKSKELWRDGAGKTFAPEEYFNLGGKTKWYGAALLRYARHEFDPDPVHDCLGWPFGYDELAPYYDEAERLLDARTFPVEKDLERIVGRVQARSSGWRLQPMQLGLRASIVSNRIEATRFDGFASVADLKSDGETAFLARLRQRPNLTILTGDPVVDLLGAAGDPLCIRGVRLKSGCTLQGRAMILAAGALHSPRLLQRYMTRLGRQGALPLQQIVGRNLKLHLLTAVVAVSATRQTDTLRKTALLLHDGLPHSSVQPLGFDGELIATLVPRLVPRPVAREVGQRAYGFFLQTEDGSHPDNRVVDGGQRASDHSTLDYDARRSTRAHAEHRTLVRQFRFALARAGMLGLSEPIGLTGTAHACGTLVTGTDASNSAVDPWGQVHGLEALYVADGSILPRSSRVNPSLTIYAWSLRIAGRLATRLRDQSRSAEVALS